MIRQGFYRTVWTGCQISVIIYLRDEEPPPERELELPEDIEEEEDLPEEDPLLTDPELLLLEEEDPL